MLWLVRSYYMQTIELLYPQIPEGTMLPAIALGLVLLVVVSLLNMAAIRRKVMSIWRRKE